MIRFEDVHKSYGSHEVLKGIDAEVAKGQVVCLIGPSGSGKSTLLRCVNGHLPSMLRHFSSQIWMRSWGLPWVPPFPGASREENGLSLFSQIFVLFRISAKQ